VWVVVLLTLTLKAKAVTLQIQSLSIGATISFSEFTESHYLAQRAANEHCRALCCLYLAQVRPRALNRRHFAGGGAPGVCDWRRAARRLTSTGGGVTGQLMLMLYLNHTNEQEQQSEKSS